METTYEFNDSSVWRVMSPFILTIALYVVGYFVMNYMLGSEAFVFLLVGYCIILLSTTALFFNLYAQYYKISKNAKLIVNELDESFSYADNNENVSAKFSDILAIDYYYNARKNKYDIWTWVSLSYCKVTLKNGRKFTFTSLLIPDFDKFFEQIMIGFSLHRHFKLYTMIAR